MQKIGGIILCGGMSRRMGTPKECMVIEGEALVVRMLRIVGEVVSPVIVSGRPDQEFPPLPEAVEVVRDSRLDAGPLAGIEAGLLALGKTCDAALVVAVDHPWVSCEFLGNLIAHFDGHRPIVPFDGARLFPLTAIYPISAASIAAGLLDSGVRTVRRFAEAAWAQRINIADLANPQAARIALRNLNRPEDFPPA